jgi:hypothetical protein
MMKQEVIRDDEYIAGLWKNHLLNQLLWMTYPNFKKQRPLEYRAPSWSWASVIGKVSFRDILEAEEQEKTARVVEVTVDTVKGKEGQITGGSLKINSKAIEGTWTAWNTGKPKSSPSVSTDDAELEGLWDEGWAANATKQFSFDVPGVKLGFTGFPDVELDGFQNGQTLCVAIQTNDRPKKSVGENFWSCLIEGLVLKDVGNNKFKRIGCFIANGKGAEYFLEKSVKKEVVII